MLKAFMDESGHSGDPACKFVGMGGVVADTAQWIAFETAWRSTLDEFIGGQAFHMKDFVLTPGRGVYEGWKESSRREFLSRLVRAILDHNIRFVGCVVSLDDFDKLFPEHRSMFMDPYYMAFQTVTRGMSLMAQSENLALKRENEPVDLVYATQHEFGATEAGRAQQLWNSMQQNTDFGKWMGVYSSESPECNFGLQAADLFAYELTQEFEHFFEEPRRMMRWAMKQFVLSMDRHILIKFFTLPVILNTLVENNQLTGSDYEKLDLQMNAHKFLNDSREVLYRRARER